MSAPTNGETFEVTDSLGRKIKIKTPGPADTLNLLEAAGENAGNPQWVRMAMMIFAVRQIDELPFPATTDKRQILARADRLGNEGIEAVYAKMFPPAESEPEGEGTEAAPSKESEEVVVAKN